MIRISLMSANWAQEAYKEDARQETAEIRAADLLITTQAILTSSAPLMWDDLFRVVREKSTEYNQLKPGFFRVQPLLQGAIKFAVASPNKTLFLQFNSKPIIVLTLLTEIDPRREPHETRFYLDFAVESGDVWFKNPEGQKLSVPSAAEYLLNTLR